MPSDYVPRNKQMHAREVRYERSDNNRDNRQFSGKRDWSRVAVFDRSPGFNPVNNGYDHANKRRPPSGRHENGRYGNYGGREHSRITDHPPMFTPAPTGYPSYPQKNDPGGYPSFPQKNDTGGYPGFPQKSDPVGGYSSFPQKNDRHNMVGGYYNGGRNGLKDGEDVHHTRDRVLSPGMDHQITSPNYHPAQSIHTSYFEDGHRGSRYGWEPLHRIDREQQQQHRPSISPDFPSERRPSRWDVQDKDYEGRIEPRVDTRIDGRLDRYGGTPRDVFFNGNGVGDSRSNSIINNNSNNNTTLDVAHSSSFSDPFNASRIYQPQRPSVSVQPQRDERPASPARKRPRLAWGQGLAMHEQKKHVEVENHGLETKEPDQAKPNENREETREATPTRDVCTPTRDPSPPPKESSSPEKITTSPMPASPAKNISPPIQESSPAAAPDEDAATPMQEDFSTVSPIKEVDAPVPVPETEAIVAPVPDLGGKIEKDEGHEPVLESAPVAEVEDVTRSPCSPSNDQKQEVVVSEPENEAPPDVPSKDVVLLQVEQLELQIDSIEKELARLDVESCEGVAESKPDTSCEAEAANPQPEDVLMEDVPGPSSGDMVADILEGLYTTADISRVKAAFGHLLPTGWLENGRKLYSSPQQSPFWARNEEQHEANKDKIVEQLVKKKDALVFKEKALALKYRLLKEQVPKPVKRPKATYRNGVNPRHATKSQITKPDGDVVLGGAAYLTKKVLSESLCPYRESHKMPAMILDDRDKPLQYIVTANRLVEDPIKYEQDRKTVNPWTADEKKIFVEKFGVFHKNFAKIATFLDHKTVGDCIEFYYRNQKQEEFAKFRKKPKRHHRAYMATTTTPVTSRFREANAANIQNHGLVAPATSSAGGKHTRNSSLKVVDHRERLTAVSDCVTLDAPGKHAAGKVGNLSGSIVTGVCSLSSDAPLTPSLPLCEKIFLQYTRQKGARSSHLRREQQQVQQQQGKGEETEAEWTDGERDLFLEAIPLFGKDFGCIALHVRTKNEGQCKTFFIKARKRLKLDKLVEQHQVSQVSGTIEEEKQAVNVNYMCEDPVEVARPTCKISENEDMDVSGVVDSGQKEENGTDPDDTSSAPPTTTTTTTTLADSPVSSVITSPGVAFNMSSPAMTTAKTSEVRIISEIPNGQVIPPTISSHHHEEAATKQEPNHLTNNHHQQQQQQQQQHVQLPQVHCRDIIPMTNQQPQFLYSLLTSPLALQNVEASQQQQLLQQQQQQVVAAPPPPPPKYAFMAADLGQLLPAKQVPKLEELHQNGRNGNFKLFGKNLRPQVSTDQLTTTTTAVPAVESWCSGSAEAQDRELKCIANGIFQNGGCPSVVADKISSGSWQILNGATCAARDLQGASLVGGHEQGLKDGVVYGSSTHLMQFGNSWGSLGNTGFHHLHQHHHHHHHHPALQLQQVQMQQQQIQQPRDPGS